MRKKLNLLIRALSSRSEIPAHDDISMALTNVRGFLVSRAFVLDGSLRTRSTERYANNDYRSVLWVYGLGVLNGLDGPVRTVIRSEVEWKRFWFAQKLPTYANSPTGLDFSRQMLLLVAPDVSEVMETRINHVSRVRDTVLVYVDLETGERAPESAPCAILPVKAVVIERVDLPVRFVERNVPRGC